MISLINAGAVKKITPHFHFIYLFQRDVYTHGNTTKHRETQPKHKEVQPKRKGKGKKVCATQIRHAWNGADHRPDDPGAWLGASRHEPNTGAHNKSQNKH